MQDRREFLAAVGAGGAALLGKDGLVLAPALTASGRWAVPGDVRSGDFGFAHGLTYLNTAALGPTPRPVLDRVTHAWRTLESNPSQQGYGPLEHAMEEVRARAAHLVGCETQELVLTTSTTDGMNIVAQGLALTRGQRVLTTDQEHPGGVSCWQYLQRRHGIALDTVAIAPGEHDSSLIVERFARALRPETRVLSVSHVLTSTGVRMPVAELAALARRHGAICVVDGAQAVGGITVDVKALGCHAYAMSGHKWLMGPKGTGLLYLAAETKGVIDAMRLEGGHAAYSASSGVVSLPLVMGLGAAVDLAESTGMREIERRATTLRHHLYASLSRAIRGGAPMEVVSPPPGTLCAPFVSVRLRDGVDGAALQRRLLDVHRVMVKLVPTNWFNGLRFSTHVFNTTNDVERLLKALRAELT